MRSTGDAAADDDPLGASRETVGICGDLGMDDFADAFSGGDGV